MSDTPFPEFKAARFIKNRYRKVFKAIIAHHHKVGPRLPSEWAKILHDEGYIQDSFELMNIPVSISMRRESVIGWGSFYYGQMSANDWTVIWDGDGKIGFEGNRERFERDAVLFAMVLDC